MIMHINTSRILCSAWMCAFVLTMDWNPTPALCPVLPGRGSKQPPFLSNPVLINSLQDGWTILFTTDAA